MKYAIRETLKWQYPYNNVIEYRYYGVAKSSYRPSASINNIVLYKNKTYAENRIIELKKNIKSSNYVCSFEIVEVEDDI